MIFKTNKNGITIGGKTVDEISEDFDKLSNYISEKASKISSNLSAVQDKINSKNTPSTWSYDELPNSNISNLNKENYSIADKIREQNEYNELLKNENSSIEAAIELSKRRAKNYDETLPKLTEINNEYEKQRQLELEDKYNSTIKERNNEYDKYLSNLNTEVEESKKVQDSIENISPDTLEELGYKQKGYLKEIREEQQQFSDALTRIDTASVESLLPKKEDVKGYYDELLAEQREFQNQLNAIETTPIDSLKRDQYSEILSEQADGQMALNLSANEYNNTLKTQNELSGQRVLALTEEANGQMALNLAESDGINSKKEDISQTSVQVAAKEALIEAQNKELLNNVKEKLVKTGVNDITGELTISRLRDIAATEGESAAIAQETLELLGLSGASKAASLALKALATIGNMIAMYAITKLITAYSDYKEKLHDIAEEMSLQAEKSSEYVDNLLDLKTQLEEGTKSSDELTSAFKDQLEAMGYTETEIDNLIAKYDGLSGAIDEATRKALENAKTDAYADVASASKALEIDSDGGLFTDILIGDYKTGLEQLDSEIEKILSDVATKTAQQGRAWIAKDHSAEGLYEYYNALKDVSRLIQETASETNNNELYDLGNVFDPTIYGEVTEAINKLKDSAELYGEAISRLHNADAQLELSDYLKTNDINSKEAFDNYINGIKDSMEYSESYKQVLIEVANKTFPQFSKQVKSTSDVLDDLGHETDISFNIENFSDNISEITSAYSTLSSAIEEYNTNGAYSLETMTKLLSLKPEYLALLVDENGKLALNEEGLRSIIQAQLEQAQAEIYATGIAKLKALSDEEAGNASENAASKMSNSTSDIDAQTEAYNQNTLAVAANEAIKDGANKANVDAIIKETEAQVKAIQNAVNGLSFNTTGVIGGFKDSAKKATEDAEKATKDYIDSYMDYMEQSLESGRIDYQTYSRDVAKFLKDMYDQGKIAAKDYHDYTKQMLEVQKDAMDSVISAVTNRLDKEIDFYEDQIDAVEERYQTEIDYLDTVIEYYENQKKALQDTNDELDRQKALEEALYNFERAQDQKTQKVNYMPSYYSNVVCKK